MAKTVKVGPEVMTEEEFNRRLDEAFLHGKATGFGDAMGLADQKAGMYFSVRKDDEAKMWRAVADWLDPLHKQAVKDFANAKNGVTDDEEK